MPPWGGAVNRHIPCVSVVVPVHNVERYVEECLESIVAQDVADLECIIVDDGSTDRSATLAAPFVAGRRGWRLIRTENRGLGAARNVGIQCAHAEYLTFADSDDVVAPGAYAFMMSALERSGSDFAVGSAKRNFPTGEKQPPWLWLLHQRRRIATTLDEFPEIMGDTFAWNKMFRRAFWDRLGLAFPAGLLYEDQVVVTRAYLLAEAFDVLVRPVYFYRIRDDGSSILQRRGRLHDLRNWIRAKQMTTALVADYGSTEVQYVWYTKVMPRNLAPYLAAIVDCDDEYWQTLRDGMKALWRASPPVSDWRKPAPVRVVAWLVMHDERATAAKVWASYESQRSSLAAPDGQDSAASWACLEDVGSGIPSSLLEP
jgi:glycosyltransferase involved in cell wall biosynthesis